ncbi:MAG: c-type cytochrome domain-containing protein [Saprospiraceae bacterium]
MGVLHPLLVHFPIALLLVAAGLEWYGRTEKGRAFLPVVPLLLLLGALGAAFSALSGYLLSRTGGYEPSVLSGHRNAGIALAATSLLLAGLYQRLPRLRLPCLLGLGVLVALTGHQGGTITHGQGYLSPLLLKKEAPVAARLSADANAYEALIKPLLQEKCSSCHGAGKQKGKLRLDSPEAIRKGGKHGFALEGAASVTLMAHRIHLPPGNEEHMPPAGRPQLSEKEKAYLEEWLKKGADPRLRIAELGLDTEDLSPSAPSPAEWPDAGNLKPATDAQLATLRALDISAVAVAQGHPLLQISVPSVSRLGEPHWEALKSVGRHIASLRLSGTDTEDAQLAWIGRLPHLTRLYLDGTKVSDAGLSRLKEARHLRYLNLVGTKISGQGLKALRDLPALSSLYLYQTRVDQAALPTLQGDFPRATLDLGGYSLPLLPGDTSRVQTK